MQPFSTCTKGVLMMVSMGPAAGVLCLCVATRRKRGFGALPAACGLRLRLGHRQDKPSLAGLCMMHGRSKPRSKVEQGWPLLSAYRVLIV